MRGWCQVLFKDATKIIGSGWSNEASGWFGLVSRLLLFGYRFWLVNKQNNCVFRLAQIKAVGIKKSNDDFWLVVDALLQIQ